MACEDSPTQFALQVTDVARSIKAWTARLLKSWSKTKIQNLAAVTSLSTTNQYQHILLLFRFNTYLWLQLSWWTPQEYWHYIKLATTVYYRTNSIWNQSALRIQAKIRIYLCCMLPVLQYGSETRTPWQILIGRNWNLFISVACVGSWMQNGTTLFRMRKVSNVLVKSN